MEVGDTAPHFTLPGTKGDDFDTYELTDFTDSGAVILFFYPFDFSPVCTAELCEVRDAEFFEFTPNVDVLGISTDSVYAHREFIRKNDLPFLLLSDNGGDVSQRYEMGYEDLDQHRDVSRRGIVAVDETETVEYCWTASDASQEFDIEILAEVREEVSAFPS
jgi:peroxiredoxin